MDTGTIVGVVAPVLAAPVAAALTGALWKAWAWLDAKATAQQKTNLETDITTAMSVGINQLLPDLIANGWHSVATKDEIVKVATAYFKQRFPAQAVGVAAAAGVATDSLASPAATDAIAETLEARFMRALVANLNAPAHAATPGPSVVNVVQAAAPAQGVASGSAALAATTLAGRPAP